MESWKGMSTNTIVNNIVDVSIENPFRVYLGQIGNIDQLDSSTQLSYIKKYRECGDIKCRNKVIESNLKFVVSICKPYILKSKDRIEPMEIISVGNEALIYAVNKFDYTNFEVGFLTYAGRVIISKVHKLINQESSMIRLSDESYRVRYHINKIYSEFNQIGMYQPCDEDVAKILIERNVCPRMNISAKMVRQLMYSDGTKSLNNGVSNDSEVELIDTLLSENESNASEFDNADDKITIKQLMSSLSEYEKDVIHMRFYRDMKLKEIANIYSVKESTIHQVITRALNKMRSCYKIINT